MNDDIVTRLRVLLSKCCIAPAMAVWSRELRDAADEIELLREQLRLANIDNFNTTAEIELLRSTVTDCRIEIERLRAEVSRLSGTNELVE